MSTEPNVKKFGIEFCMVELFNFHLPRHSLFLYVTNINKTLVH